MGNYAVNADVAKRLPTRQLTSASTPSTTDVDQWITELEAEVDGLLAAAGAGVPITVTRGLAILKAKVTSGAVARWKLGVAAGTTFEDGRTADQDWAEWQAFLKKLEAEPGVVTVMLGGSAGNSSSTSQLRSYATDNDDGLTIDNGDFDPPLGLRDKN